MEKNRDKAKEFYGVYELAATNLRSWFIVYGVGGPVFIVSQEAIWNKFKNGWDMPISIIFLVGVLSQIFIAMLNKHVMWICYDGEEHPRAQKKCCYLMAKCISKQYWIDILCDSISLLCFIVATLLVLIMMLSA